MGEYLLSGFLVGTMGETTSSASRSSADANGLTCSCGLCDGPGICCIMRGEKGVGGREFLTELEERRWAGSSCSSSARSCWISRPPSSAVERSCGVKKGLSSDVERLLCSCSTAGCMFNGGVLRRCITDTCGNFGCRSYIGPCCSYGGPAVT
jgi:hypothetical protein